MEKFLKKLFTKKEKIKEEPGVIGHYDSKPFHSFKYALIYANELLLSESDDEKTTDVMIYTRTYKNTTFINVLVYDDKNFTSVEGYDFESLKPLLEKKGAEIGSKSVVMILFQKRNENTISLAKKFCNSSKYHFQQALVYNAKRVQMDFYKPVPVFYKLYDVMCENLYFDLAFIDDKRD